MTDLCILCKIVVLFFPTSSFTAWFTSAEYPPRTSIICYIVSLGSQEISLTIPTLVDHISGSSSSLSLRGYPTKDSSFQWLTLVLLFVNYSSVDDSVGPHLSIVCISQYIPWCLHTPILIRQFRLDLWIPWRHFWNKFQVFSISKNRILRAVLCLARYLVWASVPHPADTYGTL